MHRTSLRPFLAVALAAAVGLGTAVAPFTSSSPDGLERVARDQGFAGTERALPAQQRAPLRDYAAPRVEHPRLATGLAGFSGTLLALALAYALGVLARRRRAGGTGRLVS